ncbi:MAG: hypothetical protein LCI00_34085 [Chloroflexi bacterium]|nr:hypothetical protein [Chloroflexota bacterium]MCC6894446.1 hypothetical protein [Anaerolineae bacterium]
MNLNHNPDAHLLNQIDKRLTGKQPIGEPVVDELPATRPVPREAFQQALEARLLAKMETLPEGETIMTAKSVYVPIRSARRGWLPLTLLAAMLAVVIAGGIVISGGGASFSEIALAQPSPSATATPVSALPLPANLPIDRTAIEVPLALLAEDSLMPKVGDSVDILALLPFSGSPSNIADVPATALPDGTRLVEKFVAFDAVVITQYISSNTTEPSTNVFSVPADEGRLLAWLVEQGISLRLQAPMNSVIPNLGDRRVVAIPIANVTAAEPIQVGDMVDVYSTCALTADGTVDCAQPANVNQTTATVIIGEISTEGQQDSVSYDSIGIAVSPDVFEHLSILNNLGMHFRLEKAHATDTAAAVPAPSGADERVTLTIPVEQFIEIEPNLQEGQTINIVFSFFYLSRPENSPSTPLKPSSQFVSIADNVMIVKIGDSAVDNTISLSVTSKQADILQWAFDQRLAVMLTNMVVPPPPQLPLGESAVYVPPTGSRIVNIPLNSIYNNTNAYTRGDSINVTAICAFVPQSKNADGTLIPASTDCSQMVEKQVVTSGLVLLPYLNPNDGNFPVVSIAVSAAEESELQRMIDAGMRFNVVQTSNGYIPTATPIGVPLTEVSFDIPLANIDAVDFELQAGDRVDIFSTCTPVDDSSTSDSSVFSTRADCTQATEKMETIATVVSIDTEKIVLAVPYYAQADISHMIVIGMHYKLVKADEAENRVIVPDGKVAISVPMSSLKMLEGERFAVGDTVDVITSYSAVDIGGAPSEFQQVITPEPGASDEVTQRMAKGTLIIGMSDTPLSTITLAVTSQEAVILVWALDSKLPISLRPSSTDANAPASPYTLQLPLDALAHWTTGTVTVGDRVDLVMGFVLGDGEQVTMNFQPYATSTWGDTFSQGEVSAQLYAPMNDTPFGPAFLRRVIHGAVITSMRVSKDATSGRLSDALVILELPAGTSSRTLEEVKGFIEAGMPYLLLKP